jgi:hypothetical protein
MRMLPSATQPLPASGPSVVTPAPMLNAGTSASLVPSDVRAVVSGVHHGRHDRTAFRTPHVRSIRPDTVHSTRHAMAKAEATRTGNGRTAPKAFGHPRSLRPRQRPGSYLVSL